ncbi:MAG: penicillin acylase family protein [Chloroflexota bacterium]
MRGVRIALVLLLVVVLIAVLGGAGALVWVTGRALPRTSGALDVKGLRSTVTVGRDINGFAHITASTPHDLFLAQGYVHAQERMWQMEVWRHISSGRLSELFGASQLKTDRFVRTLGWRAAAERDLAGVAPETRAILDAYAEGVNAWLDANRGNLGLAFLVAGDDPEPWSPIDTMAWAKVQAWTLGANMGTEIFRYLADARLGDPARTDELIPPYRDGAPVIAPSDGAAKARGVQGDRGTAGQLTPTQTTAWLAVAAAAAGALHAAGLDEAGGLASDHGIGSNDWVVAPTMSATGGALLANDPHLGISIPSIWFVDGLHCVKVDAECPYDVAGVSFPGVPGVVLGHNARIAWGATNAGPDVQDLVLETVDPSDPARYIGPDRASHPFASRTEEIRVKGAPSETIEIRETSHGPILNGVDPRLKDAPLMALRWTGTLPAAAPDRTFEAVQGLDAAANFDEFRATLSKYGAPSQNFVYADVDGHIGYQLPGYIPVRSRPDDRGDRPVHGDDGSGEWTGRIPYDELPHRLDPTEGWIVTANNAPVNAGYPQFIGREWDPGYRAERIIDLINDYGQDGLTTAEMSTIQNDTAPLRARDIVGLLPEVTPSTTDGATMAARIADWDGACDADSLGCAAFMTWEYHLERDLFDDDLGDLARDYIGTPPSWVVLTRLLGEPNSPWWDDVRTPAVHETADALIARAMDEAGADLRSADGGPESWSWGRLHTATFEEATLGTSGIGPLEWYFNDGPIGVPGAAGAIDNTYYRLGRAYPDPTDPEFKPLGINGLFTVTNLPSYRLVIDLHDLDGARLVITTGQSGNPFDGHYNDEIDAWRNGNLLPLPFTASAIRAATVSTLTLNPG